MTNRWHKVLVMLSAAFGLIAMMSLLGGCYIGPGAPVFSILDDDGHHVYKLYPGEQLPDSKVVKIKLSEAYFAQIDGLLVNRADYEQVHVLPGEHEIRWGRWFAVSVMVDPDMFDEGGHTALVELKAGHTYELHADRTTGHGYEKYFWMTDAATGEVVAGDKKP